MYFMQNVKMSRENFFSLPKNELISLEHALWFVQDDGFIPLPRKCTNKKDIYILFIDNSIFEDSYYLSKFKMSLYKSKIIKYRISSISQKYISKKAFGYMLVAEIATSTKNCDYFFEI